MSESTTSAQDWQPGFKHQKLNRLSHLDGIAFSPQATHIAVVDCSSFGGEAPGGIWIYEHGVEEPVHVIQPPEGQPFGKVIFTPDGKHLIAFRDAHFFNHDHDAEFVYFETSTWQEKHVVTHDEGVQDLRLLPQRKQFLATDCYSSFWLFDLKTRKQQAAYTYGHICARAIVASADEKWLAFQSDDDVKMIDLDSGELLWQTPLNNKNTYCYAAAFSPDGQNLVVGTGKSLAVLDTSSGKILRYLRRKGDLENKAAIYSPGGKYLLVAEHFAGGYGPDETCGLRVWHPETGTAMQTFSGPPPHHAEMWEVMVYWPDAKTLALIGQTTDTLCEVDVSGVDLLQPPPPPEPIMPKPDLLQTTKPGQQLLDAIIRDPENLSPRRKAATWLQKQGDTERAEFIRKQCSKKEDDLADAEDLLVQWFDHWTVALAEFKLGPDALEFRHGFPYSLTLTGNDVTDASLSALAAFPTIEYLDLSNTSVTAKGIAKLNVLPVLRELNLRGAAATSAAVKHLMDHQHLQDIRHDWRESADREAVEAFKEKRNERFAALDFKTQQREALRFFQRRMVYPELKTTSTKALLSQCGLTDADLCYLSALPKLHTVDLYECPLKGHGLTHLKDLPIKSLALAETGISTLAPLAEFSRLEELTLGDVYEEMDAAEFQHLQHLPLNSLTYNTGLTDDGVPELLKLQSLEKLNLEGCDITEESAAQIKAGLPNLVPRHYKHDWK